MDVAITGSSGLIGTALAQSLRAHGHRVVRVVRSNDEPSADAVPWDPTNGTIDAGRLEGIDAVIHLAGAGIGDKRWSEERKRELVDSRLGPTRLLAETLADLDRPPAVLVSASAVGYYGDRGDEILTEESAMGHGFLADLCRDWETAATPAADAGIRLATIRSGVVLSKAGGALAKQLPFFRFGLGGRLGSGDQYQSWISIEDHIGAVRWLLDHEVEGPVDLTAPSPVTNREFTKTLGRVLRRPTIVPTPSLGPKLLFGSEMVEEMIFASQRVLPAVLEAGGYAFRHPTLQSALRAILADR